VFKRKGLITIYTQVGCLCEESGQIGWHCDVVITINQIVLCFVCVHIYFHTSSHPLAESSSMESITPVATSPAIFSSPITIAIPPT
jgi:thiosulfate reductase cytochrome b subunit